MPAAVKRTHLSRYLPHVLLATFSVAIAPLLAVYVLERYGVITSSFAATAVGIGLSVGLARFGTWLWMRHRGSRDLVFGDLMLWGWIKRVRNEKRMNDAVHLLGFHGDTPASGVEMSSKRQGEILRELAASLERGDPFTHGHTRRVTRFAYNLAKTMRLPKETVVKIRAAAAVHDVGKIDTPPEILNKQGPLTDEEFAIMKRHSVRGAEMVGAIGDPEIKAFVLHHHERIDGRGYPDNLKGEEIPLGARVIAVADTFDAVISTRPYRSARSHKEGIEILKRAAGTQLDEEAVEAFLSYYGGRKPLAWWLSVSTGVQRVLGGFGGWLQHAKAASFTQGATSLGATIALTTAMATVAPTLGVGQHSGPALPENKPAESIVVDAGDLDPSDPIVEDETSGEAASNPSDGADEDESEPGEVRGTSDESGPRDDVSQSGSSGSEGEFVAEPSSDEESTEEPEDDSDFVAVTTEDDTSDDEVTPTPNGNARGHDKDKDEDKSDRRGCKKDDGPDDDVVVAGPDGDPVDFGGNGGDRDKKKDDKSDCRPSQDEGDKDKDKDDKGSKDDEGSSDEDDDGPGNGNGNGHGKDKDKDKDKDADDDEVDDEVEDVDGDAAPSDEGGEDDVVVDPEDPVDPEPVVTVASEPETPVEVAPEPVAPDVPEEADAPPVEEVEAPPADATVPVEDED